MCFYLPKNKMLSQVLHEFFLYLFLFLSELCLFLFYLSLIFLSLIRHPRVNENTAKACHINSVK